MKSRTNINNNIKAKQVRLISEFGKQIGIVTIKEALYKADLEKMDLVEIASSSYPPICRIMNYNKYMFDKNKKIALTKKRKKIAQIKEIKLRPNTDIGDFKVKLRHLIRFLKNRDKVKVTVKFKGREISHKQLGLDILKRMEDDSKPYSIVEKHPKIEGRTLTMVLAGNNKILKMK